ncbi:hypothetical protein S40293_00102 [Stachybotrys chartarum IBT 40293]|nr:hypothetical protein S40293_00102 [Stachybotrys chartarum IBT 40293]
MDESTSRNTAYMNRRRAARACDGCRKVKEKCEGGIPCRRCTHLQRNCAFSGHPGRARTSAAAQPDTVPGHDMTVPELLRRMANMERLLGHFVGNSKLDSETLQTLADSVDVKRAREPSAMEQRDLDGGEDEQEDMETASNSSGKVKLDEVSFQPLENNATHYSGEFSHWNFSMRIKNWIEQTGPHRTDAPDAPKIKEFYRFEELQSPPDPSSLSSSFPPRHIADFLARAFFNHAESNYFFVDRTWLNRKLDVVFENPASLSRRDVPTLCIMYMVLAVGTQYAFLDSRDSSRNGADTGPFSEDNVGLMLYQQACKLLPDVITIASLESVQACLLIGLYTMPIDPSGLSWTYLNLASKLAIQNGMHRRYPSEGLDLVVRETRSRVWWTLYTLEKRVGTFHGRPISIPDNEIDADWPAEKPDIWPGSPPKNTPHLLASLHLCRSLGKISREISHFKMHDRRVTFCALSRLVDIKQELHLWWQQLPPEVRSSDAVAETGGISREAAHVRLELCVVRMYAGRLFIMPRRSTQPAANTPSTDEPSPENGPTTPSIITSQNAQRRSVLIADCVDAALCIVDTCSLLRASIGLARASYTEFSALRVALLVILSQFLQKQTNIENLRQPLVDGMAMLKSMSTWGASARFDVSLIEAFEHAIARMEDGARRTSAPRESEYDMFKKWEEEWHSTKNGTAQQPTDKSFDPSLGIPSLVDNAAGDVWGGPVPKPGSSMGLPASTGSGPGFFGMEGGFPSMPMLESLSATLGHGYGFDVNPQNPPGTGRSGGWMGL